MLVQTVRVAVFAEGPSAEEARAAGADIVGGNELIEEIKTGITTSFMIENSQVLSTFDVAAFFSCLKGQSWHNFVHYYKTVMLCLDSL